MRTRHRPLLGLGATQATIERCWPELQFRNCFTLATERGRDACLPDRGGSWSGYSSLSECEIAERDKVVDSICVPSFCPGSSTPPPEGWVKSQPSSSDATDYPWHAFSPKTEALQIEINKGLPNHGKCPVEVDGKLGKSTCGAAQYLLDNLGADMVSVPSTCREFQKPSDCPVPVQQPPKTAKVPPEPPPDVGPTPVAPPPSTGVSKASMLGGALALSAVAVGGYYYGKKKGWFK